MFPFGLASQEGSLKEGDQVLSINGTALKDSAHWEALRTLRKARTRGMAVVVLQKGGAAETRKSGADRPQAGADQEAVKKGEDWGLHVPNNRITERLGCVAAFAAVPTLDRGDSFKVFPRRPDDTSGAEQIQHRPGLQSGGRIGLQHGRQAPHCEKALPR